MLMSSTLWIIYNNFQDIENGAAPASVYEHPKENLYNYLSSFILE